MHYCAVSLSAACIGACLRLIGACLCNERAESSELLQRGAFTAELDTGRMRAAVCGLRACVYCHN